MNSTSTIRLRINPDGTAVRVFPDGHEEPYDLPEPDWERLDAMTDEEVEANALADPDAPPLTDEQLDRGVLGRRVRVLRERLALSQTAFAQRFRIPVASLRDWEQGRRMPDSATLAYLTVIEREPEAVMRALAA
ncbi:MAG TPA: helix-turn-helix domain-containing protein [Azospirillum sp.]